jgi:hypothetical protein
MKREPVPRRPDHQPAGTSMVSGIVYAQYGQGIYYMMAATMPLQAAR